LDTASADKFPWQNVAMEEFRIRPATLDDLSHILRHRRLMFRDMGSGTDVELDAVVVAAESFFRNALPRGEYRGWLALTEDGRVAAGAGITIVPWPGAPCDPVARRGWIQNVYTEPEFRRHGLARRLMETVVDWCRTEGFYTVSLHASHEGRSLYESMGFRDTNEMRLFLR
jgi:GNAT superfamily N-acetyltransferase